MDFMRTDKHVFVDDHAELSLSESPPPGEPLNCPRCGSTNTKFCYCNNYSKSQPRHFCRSCRRHWTSGGKIRNVPIGGGRRKKRPRPRTSTATAEPRQRHCQINIPFTNNNINAYIQKSMSSILYRALISSSSSPSLRDTTAAPFSNLGSCSDVNNSARVNPTSYQSLINYHMDNNYPGNIDYPTHDSTILHNWNETDVLASSSADANIALDDFNVEIKSKNLN